MPLLDVTDGPPIEGIALFEAGRSLSKEAGDPELVYNLSGRLYLSGSGWILLSVPNSLARGLFSAMAEPGIELPPGSGEGDFNAHISVMRPEDVEMIGGPEKITERGKHFKYTIGRIYSVEPESWKEMAKVWYAKVHSPELMELRRSYGLSSLPKGGEYDFHITVAVRRKSVLGRNEVAKGSSPER